MQAQHGHLEAGATSPTDGSHLVFVNGDHFSPESGFIQPLVWAADGLYGGYFHGNITMTVRAATAQRGGPEPSHPALGAEVSIELLGVEGPPGGAFAFWESGAEVPTYSVAAGRSSEDRWLVSENDGLEGSDPFGHVHGRRFTATTSGIYTATFRLHDESSNGADGGTIHKSSETIEIRFIAGDGIPVAVRNEGHYVLAVEDHDGTVEVVAREDDGHSDHVHDPLNLAKTIFEVNPKYRVQAGIAQAHLGDPGDAAWQLPARPMEVNVSSENGAVHDASEHESIAHEHSAHDGNEAAESDESSGGHDHASTIDWDGLQTPSLSLEALEDTPGAFNLYLSLSGFAFSPENASSHHIPGEGHAHVYVDGVKLGRIYSESYFLSGLSAGPHTIRVTLNANSHQDYIFEGGLLEASVEVVASEKTEGSDVHGHQHGKATREWDGGTLPHLTLEVRPDPSAGWNLLFDYTHFQLNPRNASQHHVPGEGHTHIYVNGEKLTRLYGRAYHLDLLPVGHVEVSVRLSSNDHLEYLVEGESLQISSVVQNGTKFEEPKHLKPLSVSLSTEGLHAGMLVGGQVSVSLLSVDGPGSLVVLSGDTGHADTQLGVGHGGLLVDSRDGFDHSDSFALRGGEFAPLSWVFSRPGDYGVSLSIHGTKADDGTEIERVIDLSFRVQPSDQLHYILVDNALHLSWDSSQQLQESDLAAGHYLEVHGAAKHHLVALSQPMKFYRLAPISEPTHNHE